MSHHRIGNFRLVETSQKEIGTSYGEALRQEIRAALDFYKRFIFHKLNQDQLKSIISRYLYCIKQYFPHYVEEMNGIARGANVQLDDIVAINARTEIYTIAHQNRKIIESRKKSECTALFFKESGILGQNWDWVKEAEEFTVILKVVRPDGHQIITLTEAGMLGKIGISRSAHSEETHGITLNMLSGYSSSCGIPIHVLLRAFLDCKSFDECLDILAVVPTETSSNIIIANKQGRYVDIEFCGDQQQILSPIEAEVTERIVLHTNGYLHEPMYRVPLEEDNSRSRYHRAETLCKIRSKKSHPLTIDDMKSILLDRETVTGSDCPIAIKSIIFPDDPSNTEYLTISSIIMDLQKGSIYFTGGSPYNSPFQTIQFS